MRRWAFLSIVMLAGCATSPADLERDGSRREVEYVGAQDVIAQCLVQRWDGENPGLVNVTRKLPDGTVRVMAHGGRDVGTLMLADLGKNGKAALLVTRNSLAPETALDWMAGTLRDCETR